MPRDHQFHRQIERIAAIYNQQNNNRTLDSQITCCFCPPREKSNTIEINWRSKARRQLKMAAVWLNMDLSRPKIWLS